MANCPKCNHKLKLTDWRPECPHCGTNVIYYNFEKQFYIDAKGAEMDAAKIRVKWARVKASFIGGKVPVARLSLSILPLMATLLSFGKLTIAFPLFEKNVVFNLTGLFSAFTDGTFDYLTALKTSAIAGVYAGNATKILFGLAAAACFALLIFIFQLFCFISAKRMAIISTATAVLGIVAVVYSMFAVNAFAKTSVSEIFTVTNGFGGFFAAAAFLTAFALNLTVAIKGIKVNYMEGDLYRIETAKKLKRGEITLDEISQPVYPPEPENEEPEKVLAGVGGGVING